MEAKNLPLKFAFAILLTLVCLWSLFSNGLAQGIDLRGGHSMVFEVYTQEAKQKQLQADKAKLEADLQEAVDDQKKQDLKQALSQVNRDLAAIDVGSRSDLVQRIISVLKRRVDPDGLLNLEWRPQGSNRIRLADFGMQTQSKMMPKTMS